jgi:hypothetical protein
MRHVLPYIFFQKPRRGRNLLVTLNVDQTALLNLCGALQPLGYRIGQIHLNYPPYPKTQLALGFSPARFSASDLILTGTRLELYPKLDCRKVVLMTGMPMERRIASAWAEVLQSSERLLVVLQKHVARYLEKGYENRNNIEFNERIGAQYSGLDRAKPRVRATAAFLLRKRELWPGGPGYLGFFGMDSTVGVAWSHLLRHRHADLLESDGFVMAELSGKAPGPVENLDWALEWESKIILRAPANFAPKTPSARNRRTRPAA